MRHRPARFRAAATAPARTLAAALAAVMMTAGLAGCSEPEPEAATSAPDGKPGVTVSDARLILPAVASNPAVMYFTVAYDGDSATMLRDVSVAGAQDAQMHEVDVSNGETFMLELTPQPLERGDSLEFAPGGRHVMVYGLPDTVQAGGSVEATLTFAGGDKASFPVTVEPAGADR